MSWLDSHQTEDAETYESKQKEVESVTNEVMQKLYAQAGQGMPGGMPGGMPDMSQFNTEEQQTSSGGATVEEVD